MAFHTYARRMFLFLQHNLTEVSSWGKHVALESWPKFLVPVQDIEKHVMLNHAGHLQYYVKYCLLTVHT